MKTEKNMDGTPAQACQFAHRGYLIRYAPATDGAPVCACGEQMTEKQA